jgi:hypothetical protein
MKILHFTTWSLLMLAVVLFVVLNWPLSGFDPAARDLGRVQELERPAAEARSEMIRTELSRTTDHEWAGVYHPEFGFRGREIEIAPSNGLVYWEYGCFGPERLNHGDVVGVDGNRIQLSLAIDPAIANQWAMEHTSLVSSNLVLVRWCDCRYLVPEVQMRVFCNEVNARGYASDVGFVREIRGQDGREAFPPVSGLPEVPPEYREYLLESPVEAGIVSVASLRPGPREHLGPLPQIASCAADAGSSSGLLPGMHFYSLQEEGAPRGTVVSVEPHTSTVEFSYDGDELSSVALPRVGWTLSTRMPAGRWR